MHWLLVLHCVLFQVVEEFKAVEEVILSFLYLICVFLWLQCIPVPDINKPQSTHSFAMTCIWIHLNRKAQNDNSKLQIPIPHSLKLHHEYVPQDTGTRNMSSTYYYVCANASCLVDFSNSHCEIRPWVCRTIRSPCCVTPTVPTRNASPCRWASWSRRSMATALWGSTCLGSTVWHKGPWPLCQWTCWIHSQYMQRWGMEKLPLYRKI